MNKVVSFRCEDWEKNLLAKIAGRSRRTLSDEVKYLIERALGRSLKEIEAQERAEGMEEQWRKKQNT